MKKGREKAREDSNLNMDILEIVIIQARGGKMKGQVGCRQKATKIELTTQGRYRMGKRQ